MDDLLEFLPAIAVSVAVLGATAATTLHAIMTKSDVRAAVGWIGLVWLSPVIGIVFYTLFGVNRIRRKATELRRSVPAYNEPDISAIFPPDRIPEELHGMDHLVPLALVGESDHGRPLLGGNSVEPLFGGEEAYPAMLDAIANAQHSVTLVTYIFDNDRSGREFIDALVAAHERGVDVRVLVDAAGARYSFPSVVSQLHKLGVPVAKFLPSSLIPPYILSINLRNHRKIMVVDGDLGFTGGMNIREDCRRDRAPKFPTRDLHFRIRGPAVMQLQQIFAEDWTFSTGEELAGERWFPKPDSCGSVIIRGVPDGPDEDLDKMRWTILGAIAAAHDSIRVVTPYFLPDEPIAEALIVAAMRGVEVDIVLPARNNLPFVGWACLGQLRNLLQFGVRVHFTRGDFDHSKLCIVDDVWVLLGSPNWDPRSLKLNFEFALECYSVELAAQMNEWIDERISESDRWSLEDHDARPVWQKVRDGVFRLGAPYL